MFLTEETLVRGSWQAFERQVSRLLLYLGYSGIRLVGQTSDHGADILANLGGKRWLFQVKHWRNRVGVDVIARTLDAMLTYRAQVPVVVSLSGFDEPTRLLQRDLLGRGIPLQLWDRDLLVSRASRLEEFPLELWTPREYQEQAIRLVVDAFQEQIPRRALIVMATGLGKTFVAAEAIRRIGLIKPVRVLALVHTNELVYQTERAFWPVLSTSQETLVWNGYERPSERDLGRARFVFACLNTVAEHIAGGGSLPRFDIVLIDECHHVGGRMYSSILEETRAGTDDGPFLTGLTATPWRADETDLLEIFGNPMVAVDMVTGLRNGFLSNVDYRMYTDNIDWDALSRLTGHSLSPKQVNRTLFISEWDDAVVLELKKVWAEHASPRAIVFCGTIDHAITMRDRINALGFCNAAAVYSQASLGSSMESYERNKVLCDFQDGKVGVLCAVDILNEGIDVPDVNIIVFQRVTHSRRIFVQQLGRGLRIAPGKDEVIVLDFVSDIRRFAAGLELKDQLSHATASGPGRAIRVNIKHKVTFQRAGSEDPRTESFLREWLDDIAAVEQSGEDASVLKFPPLLKGARP